MGARQSVRRRALTHYALAAQGPMILTDHKNDTITKPANWQTRGSLNTISTTCRSFLGSVPVLVLSVFTRSTQMYFIAPSLTRQLSHSRHSNLTSPSQVQSSNTPPFPDSTLNYSLYLASQCLISALSSLPRTIKGQRPEPQKQNLHPPLHRLLPP